MPFRPWVVLLLFTLTVFGKSFDLPSALKEYLYLKGLQYVKGANYVGALEIFRFLGDYKNSSKLYAELKRFFGPVPVSAFSKEPFIRVKIASFSRFKLMCPERVVEVFYSPRKGGLFVPSEGKTFSSLTFGGLKNCSFSADGRVEETLPRDGKLLLFASADGGLAVLEIPLEDYLKGVLSSEVYPSWPLEVLKAQAVASRTYALFNIYRAREAGKVFDVDSSTRYQVFKLYKRSFPSVERAVEATRGEVLTYNGSLIYAMFNANNGGCSHSFEEITGVKLPYLSSVEDNCTSPLLRWNFWIRKLPMERFEEPLRRAGLDFKVSRLEVLRNRCGRGLEITLVSPEGREITLPLSIFYRMETHLPSDWFYPIARAGGYLLLKGRGFGHGLGMSQWGAYCLAKRGWDYRRILDLYYRGAEVKKIY